MSEGMLLSVRELGCSFLADFSLYPISPTILSIPSASAKSPCASTYVGGFERQICILKKQYNLVLIVVQASTYVLLNRLDIIFLQQPVIVYL